MVQRRPPRSVSARRTAASAMPRSQRAPARQRPPPSSRRTGRATPSSARVPLLANEQRFRMPLEILGERPERLRRLRHLLKRVGEIVTKRGVVAEDTVRIGQGLLKRRREDVDLLSRILRERLIVGQR